MSNTHGVRSLLSAALFAGLTYGSSALADSFYTVHNLVSNLNGVAAHTDSNLKNGWGIAASPTSPIWVANNGTGTSTLYDGNGIAQPQPTPLVVNIPAPGGGPGRPTGIVFNNTTSDFNLSDSGKSGKSAFIFATEDGAIAAWSPAVNATNAIIVYPAGGAASTAIYKGLALANNGTTNFIYATDFHNSRVDVFDTSFNRVTTLSGNFTDPKLPKGYGPFGIQNLGGNVYVTFAKQDEDAEDDIAHQGFGIVDEFTANGEFVRRVAQHGQLNAPWGLAIAPANFGCFSNALIVGNFGDGRLNAFDIASGELLGALRGQDHKRIVVDGLWGIAFGNGNLARNQAANVLFFAAGPNDEDDGLFGRIEATGSGTCDESEDND